MGWTAPWFSSFGSEFNYDFGVTTDGGDNVLFALSVFLQGRGHVVYRSYVTSSRGVDRLRLDFNLLDLTPFGRQEEWEDSPAWVGRRPRRTRGGESTTSTRRGRDERA